MDLVEDRIRTKKGAGFTSEYRLVNLQDRDPESGHTLDSQLTECVDQLVFQSLKTWADTHKAATWCWIEVRYGKGGRVLEVNVWDATAAPVLKVTKPLISFPGQDNKFQVRYSALPRPKPIPQKPPVATVVANIPKSPWRLALISSFCTGTFTECAKEYELCNVPKEIGVDLYCFMHRAMKDVFERKVQPDTSVLSRWRQFSDAYKFSNPTQFLSFLDPTSQHPHRADDATRNALCQDICAAFPSTKRKILALSTYFPQITNRRKEGAAEEETEAEAAVSALTTVGWLANELNRQGHEVQSIELVAGTRVRGLFPKVHSKDGFDYHADLTNVDEGIELLRQRSIAPRGLARDRRIDSSAEITR